MFFPYPTKNYQSGGIIECFIHRATAYWVILQPSPVDGLRVALNPILTMNPDQSWIGFFFCISFHWSRSWKTLPSVRCIHSIQRGYNEGSVRVQLGLPIPTLTEPSLYPNWTLTEPPLKTERNTTIFRISAFVVRVQFNAIFLQSKW